MYDEPTIISKAVGWLLLAGMGGAAKYVATVIRSDERISNRRFLMLFFANVFISSFCGLMGGLMMSGLALDSTWQYVACGTFGYLGTQSIDLVLTALKKKIDPRPLLTAS